MIERVDVVVQPLGSTRVEDALAAAAGLEEVLPVEARVRATVWRLPPPLSAYDFHRMQYRADLVAEFVEEYYKGFLIPFRRLVVAIVDADGYVEGLNFVFGLALPRRGVAVVFTRRLEEGVTRERYLDRLVKEVAHEVGHLLGLSHCPRRECVMSFSNSIVEVDAKRAWFCPDCRARLSRMYRLKEGARW